MIRSNGVPRDREAQLALLPGLGGRRRGHVKGNVIYNTIIYIS